MITLKHPMIKELSLAVIFGLLIGFGLTGTFYFVKQNNNSRKNTPNIVIPTPASDTDINAKLSPTISLSTTSELEITSPQNNDIINTSKTTIKGLTSSNSFIIITTPKKNYHFSADAQGDFSYAIDLEPGLNAINITAIDQKDQENHIELLITYSTTKLE